MANANPALVTTHAIYDAFRRGDLPYILSQVGDRCEWRCAVAGTPFSGAFVGRKGVQTFFERVVTSIRMDRLDTNTFLADGDTVVVLGADNATVLATGRPYVASWVHVWRFADGRVVEFTEYMDGIATAAAFAA